MSSDDSRISTEELLALAEPVHVDTLTRWEGDPYAGDVGQRALQSETFGQIGLILTYGTEVLYGSDLVEAQKHQPDDDGMVPVVDLAAAGFPRPKAEAAVLGLWANHRDSTVDAVVLAEVMASIIQEDEAMALAVGFDGDDLDALIESLEVPSETNWADAFDAAPQGGDSEITVMSFTVHTSDAELINQAIDAAAEAVNEGRADRNANQRGNALAVIAETYGHS